MFLHLGGNCIVLAAQVITILNLKSTKDSKITSEMRELLRAEGLVAEACPGVPKSLIITDEKAYLSPISSVTLKNRLRPWKSYRD
ncbi:MAG: DUF370 domain-containing protein [Firmicutes bacterium]|nr:DUF370 domain-containing protein [Bacillota bacterium]